MGIIHSVMFVAITVRTVSLAAYDHDVIVIVDKLLTTSYSLNSGTSKFSHIMNCPVEGHGFIR